MHGSLHFTSIYKQNRSYDFQIDTPVDRVAAELEILFVNVPR